MTRLILIALVALTATASGLAVAQSTAPGPASTARPGACLALKYVTAQHSVPDLWLSVAQCLTVGDFDRAARLYRTTLAYGAFDAQFAADPARADEIQEAYFEKVASTLSEAQHGGMGAAMEELDQPFQAIDFCMTLGQAGPPAYRPDYLRDAGKLRENVDRQQAWTRALDSEDLDCASVLGHTGLALLSGYPLLYAPPKPASEFLLHGIPAGYTPVDKGPNGPAHTFELHPPVQGAAPGDPQLIISQVIGEAAATETATSFRDGLQAYWNSDCETESFVDALGSTPEKGYPVEAWMQRCSQHRQSNGPLTLVAKVLQGESDLYFAALLFAGNQPSDDQIKAWFPYLSRVTVCDARKTGSDCGL